jgi:hypothetical protein
MRVSEWLVYDADVRVADSYPGRRKKKLSVGRGQGVVDGGFYARLRLCYVDRDSKLATSIFKLDFDSLSPLVSTGVLGGAISGP